MDEGQLSSEEPEWGLLVSFFIDTDAYTDRDRHLFCCGYEFCSIVEHLRFSPGSLSTTVHRENESRSRMAAARFGRKVTLQICEPEYDPQGIWSYLLVEGRGGKENEEGDEENAT